MVQERLFYMIAYIVNYEGLWFHNLLWPNYFNGLITSNVFLSLRRRHTVLLTVLSTPLAFGIASKEPKNYFASSSIQKRRVCGIDDIAVFLVRNARSLNSWIVQTLKSAGMWAFKKFEIQSPILFKLFDTIFGESQMTHWKCKSKYAKEMRFRKRKAIRSLLLLILEVLKSY